MPLVVPILRMFMLFLNVFETFKTMKPPSGRRSGQPSVRAITQRKRDMKGCLAVWIVWCCFATYERLFEGFVCFLVPFYGELKSIVLLFLLVTRARGAEPIYLHVIRPLIKPYASTVDSLLDLARMFGDIFFFVSSAPLRHALSWWNGSLQGGEDVQETEGNHPEPSLYGVSRNLDADGRAGSSAYPAIVPLLSGLAQTTLVEEPLTIPRENSIDEGTEKQRAPFEKSNSKGDLAPALARTRRQGLQPGAGTIPPSVPSIVSSGRRSDGNDRNDERSASIRSSLDVPKPHEPQLYRWQLNDHHAKAVLPHEIWHPPPSAYDGSADDQDTQPKARRSSNPRSHSSSSALAESTPPPAESTPSELPDVDEWRLYAPFPSAYPPTPLPGPVKLPPAKSNIASTLRRSSDKVQFPPISEENVESFGHSLQPLREPPNPGSDGNLSDDKISTIGVQNDSSSDEESMAVDSDDEEEDDFDITLQTPRRPRVATLSIQRPQLNAMASTSSLVSSAALSTVDNGMTLRTRSSSESSSSMSLSDTDSSSAPSHKTSVLKVGGFGVQNPARTTNKAYATQSSKSGEISSRIVPEIVHIPPTRQVHPSANEPVDENTSALDKDGKVPGAGKRRVALPPKMTRGSSTSLPPTVPEKDDATSGRAAINGPVSTRGRGRGRGLAPSRSSSRIANSRPPPASSNSSQINLADTKPTDVTPPPRDRTIRNRRG